MGSSFWRSGHSWTSVKKSVFALTNSVLTVAAPSAAIRKCSCLDSLAVGIDRLAIEMLVYRRLILQATPKGSGQGAALLRRVNCAGGRGRAGSGHSAADSGRYTGGGREGDVRGAGGGVGGGGGEVAEGVFCEEVGTAAAGPAAQQRPQAGTLAPPTTGTAPGPGALPGAKAAGGAGTAGGHRPPLQKTEEGRTRRVRSGDANGKIAGQGELG